MLEKRKKEAIRSRRGSSCIGGAHICEECFYYFLKSGISIDYFKEMCVPAVLSRSGL